MTTNVDSPAGNKDADSSAATPEVRQSTGAHDLSPTLPPPSGTTLPPPSGTTLAPVDPSAGTQEVPPVAPEPQPLAEEQPETLFRFPAPDDPDPGWQRLLGMSVYAAILGVAWLGVGTRGLAASIGGSTPGWYLPVLASTGLLSIALTVAAFLSIHRQRLPWMLLLAATPPLVTAVILAVAH